MEEGRQSKDEYYIGIARAVAARSTCLRRRLGAVIVKDDAIIDTGYNGTARGLPNCIEHGCLKEQYSKEHGAAEGKNYEKCRAGPLHAEINAIINAARHGNSVINSRMYITGFYAKTGEKTEAKPCKSCQKAILNSGIEEIIIETLDGFKKIAVSEWAKEAWQEKDKDIIGFY